MSHPTLIVAHTAESEIKQYELVAFGTGRGKVVRADGSTTPCGVCCQPGTCAIGDIVDVAEAGIVEVLFGGEVAAGSPVASNAEGKAVAAEGAATVVGYARHAAIDGEIGEITLAPAAVAAGLAAGAAGLALLGDETAAEARATLELGGAATLDVGAAAGTVCAGDDARLSDARTPADGSVTSAKLAAGVPFVLYAAIAAGEAAAADDVVLVAETDGAMRVLDATLRVSDGAAADRTATLRDAVEGGGNALSDAFDCATTGRKEQTGATAEVAAGGTLVLYRSHDAIAGELLVTLVREA